MLHGVKAGTLGKHPARENALHFASQRHLVDLDEGGRIRGLGRRPGVADARRYFERAELHRLIQGNFEMRDAPRHLVERGEHGDLVLDDLGVSCARTEPKGDRDGC
jgi:hypothetical protein